MVSVRMFTRDLRVADKPALHAAVTGAAAVLPLFVLDEDMLAARFAGYRRRLAFLLESLAGLYAVGYPRPVVDHADAAGAHRARSRRTAGSSS